MTGSRKSTPVAGSKGSKQHLLHLLAGFDRRLQHTGNLQTRLVSAENHCEMHGICIFTIKSPCPRWYPSRTGNLHGPSASSNRPVRSLPDERKAPEIFRIGFFGEGQPAEVEASNISSQNLTQQTSAITRGRVQVHMSWCICRLQGRSKRAC